MSSTAARFGLLAFAAAALANPHVAHGHARMHARGTGPAPYPYPYPYSSNSTSLYLSTGTGTAVSWTCTETPESSPVPAPPPYSQSSPAPAPVYSTVTVSPIPASPTGYSGSWPAESSPTSALPSPPPGYAWTSPAGEWSTCAQDVTVTVTQQTTVWVTAGASAPAPAPAYSSSEASPSQAPAPAPAYSSSESSAAPAPAPYTPASSAAASSAVPQHPENAVPAASSAAATPSSASAASVSKPSGFTPAGRGKRGLAYNDAALTDSFLDNPNFSWAYNWLSSAAGLGEGVEYIPMLHDGSSNFTATWFNDAKAAIASGSKVLFSFNEPDDPTQANMSPQDAAQVYLQYMQPFAGQAQLCAPAVTNGVLSQDDTPMGFAWLSEFLAACQGCTIDCFNHHWYNTVSPGDDAELSAAIESFETYVEQAVSNAGDKPVWISEFALSGASGAQVTSLLEDAMPKMDANPSVVGYAYYWIADGFLMDGSSPSSYGEVYASYTGST